MDIAEFQQLLDRHDWYYQQADDSAAYNKGYKERMHILEAAKTIHDGIYLFRHAQACVHNNLPIDFQTYTGPPVMAENKTNHNINTHNIMKEIIALLFAELIKPIVDAIKENTAAVKTSVTGKPATVKEEEPETEVIPPKGKGKGKGKTPAADDDEPPAHKYTLDDIKAGIKSLDDDETKAKAKAWMKKNLEAETLADLDEDKYPLLAAHLVKLGATVPGAPKGKANDDDFG